MGRATRHDRVYKPLTGVYITDFVKFFTNSF